MAYREKYLVHWTGKDKDTNNKTTPEECIKILSSILSDGFLMSTPEETLRGDGDSTIEYKIPMVCFTEINIGQSQNHAEKFGPIGIVVNRKYVLNRYGGPVHYVRNSGPETVVQTASILYKYFDHLTKNHHAIPPKGFITREELIQLQQDGATETQYKLNVFRQRLESWIGFIKNMSDERDDFSLLEEMEWRICLTPKLKNITDLVKKNKSGNFYIAIETQCLEGIAFLNEDLKRIALNHEGISEFSANPSVFMGTIDEWKEKLKND